MSDYDNQPSEDKTTDLDSIAQMEDKRAAASSSESENWYKNTKKGIQEHSREAANEEKDKLEKRLNDTFGGLYDQDKGLYKPDGKKKISALASLLSGKKKGVLIGTGGGVAGIAITAAMFFGFLSGFKLDHIIGNIEMKSFARFNAALDGRSDKWLKAYVALRLAEFEGSFSRTDDQNLYFRSNKIDNDNPLKDWYKTLRSNRFEEEILNKRGIVFTSAVDANGNIRVGSIQVDKETFTVDTGLNGRSFSQVVGDSTEFNRFIGKLDVEAENLFSGPGSHAKARRHIKNVVNEDVHFLRVFKRRHLRKDIQNKIGVREWRLFETSRDKLRTKRADFQKKMLQKFVPNDTKSGKFLLCIFGAGPCSKNADTNNSANQADKPFDGSRTAGENKTQPNETGTAVATDADGKPIIGEVGANQELSNVTKEATDVVDKLVSEGAEEIASDTVRKQLLSNIMSKLNLATAGVSIVRTMDMLARVDSNLTSGKLSQIAVVAKGAQAAAAFTTYAIARDQARTGELGSDEYGYLMQTLSGAERSEAGSYFLGEKAGTVSAATSKEEFCSDEYVPTKDDFWWNCDSTKIGGKTNGTRIEKMYENSIGRILTPLANGYREARDAPGIGLLFDALSWAGDSLDSLVSKVTDPIFNALGINRAAEKVMGWLTEKVINFLGAGPILTGANDPPGLVLTMIGQGAEYTAEMSQRATGAALSNPVTKAYADDLTFAYLNEQQESRSIGEKYFALSSPTSLASQTLFSLTTSNFRGLGFLGTLFKNMGNITTSMFSKNVHAQSADPLFSGIDRYDFPQYCIEREPLAPYSPADLTNADDLTNQDGKPFIDRSQITMELLQDQDGFWNKVYERVGDNETDAERVLQVYNCETLDQRIRGSLGYTSNYVDDGGLEDGAAVSNTPPSSLSAPGLNGYTIPCTGIPSQQKTVGARSDAVNWSGIKDSGTIGMTSGGQPIKVYIREPCSSVDVKTVVIASSIHASENYGQPISFELLFKKDLPENMRVIAIPEINGSGLTSSVPRTNANGVNLNRNFDYRWNEMSGDELNSSTTNYRGASPESEPETQAIVNFLKSIPDISLLIAYHDNLNYVGASHETNTALATNYQQYLKNNGINMALGNSGGVQIKQKGSLDAWFNAQMRRPALLVEMPATASNIQLGIHADAVINLVRTGGL